LQDSARRMSRPVPHIEVDLTLLPTERGGRRAPIFSGFTSAFHCDGEACDSISELQQLEFVFPGERARIFLSFRHPEIHRGRLAPGKPFQLVEGRRVIGEGRVMRLVGLAKPSESTASVAAQ